MKLLFTTCYLFLCTFSLSVQSQNYPNKPVKIIVPFETGAPNSIARIIAQQLSIQTGQSFIVENHPGANGIIGTDLVAKSTKDGYSLLLTSTSIAVIPSYYKKLSFNIFNDLSPITNIGKVDGLFIVVNTKLPVSNIKEFINYAKDKNNSVSYGSPGNGNQMHIASALFNKQLHLDMVHIPFKGAGPATVSLLGNQIQILLTTPPTVLQHIKDGKLKAIAYTGKTRSKFLPNVPTLLEQGISMDLDGGWFALFAPSGTPDLTVKYIQSQIKTALENKDVIQNLYTIGIEPVGDSPQEFNKYLNLEYKKYNAYLSDLKIHSEDN